jgi:hypothetical protein
MLPSILVRWPIHVSTMVHALMLRRLRMRAHAAEASSVHTVRSIFDLVNRGLALTMANVMRLVPQHFSVNAILATKVFSVNRSLITVVVSNVKTMDNVTRLC